MTKSSDQEKISTEPKRITMDTMNAVTREISDDLDDSNHRSDDDVELLSGIRFFHHPSDYERESDRCVTVALALLLGRKVNRVETVLSETPVFGGVN